MTIYTFGNPDYAGDDVAIIATKTLQQQLPNLEFIFVKPNQDLPFIGQDEVILMDTVQGLTKVRLFTDAELGGIILPPRTSAHDFDLNFQLKYLKKLGKIGRVSLIGLPMTPEIDYPKIHEVIKQLS